MNLQLQKTKTFSRWPQLAHQLALKLLLWRLPFPRLTFLATFIVWVHNIFTQLSSILFYMPKVFHFGRVCWQKFQNQYFKFLPTGSTPLRNREPVESISSPGSRRKRHCVGFLNVFSLNCVSSIKAKRGGRPNSFAGKKPMKTFYILL